MRAPFQFKSHFLFFLAAVLFLVLVFGIAHRFQSSYSTQDDANWEKRLPEKLNGNWRVILSDEVPQLPEDAIYITIRIHTFHDLNLDGLQGDPEIGDAQVRLYNVEDYTDTRLFTESPLTHDEVRLCFRLICKSPDENGDITFNLPKFIFDGIPGITLRMDYREGRYPYYTFNDPYTVMGRLENQTIILAPQYSGGGDIFLPTAAAYDEFTIGFSDYPCVLPFDESVISALLPMNFFDFDPNQGTILNFDDAPPQMLKEIDSSLGNYHSDNHDGLDFYYPREEQVIRYACVIEPEFIPNSSSDEYGNLVFTVRNPVEGDFFVGFGHVAFPSVEAMATAQSRGESLRFGDAFAVVGAVGTSINHLHFSYGEYTDPNIALGKNYCAVPPFPFINGTPPYPGIQHGISQLEEELCFSYSHSTYLAHQIVDGKLYAPFVPSIPLVLTKNGS